MFVLVLWLVATTVASVASRDPLQLERAAWHAREARLLERIGALERELAQHERWREGRTREWLAFTKLISELELPGELSLPSYAASLQPRTDENATEAVESPEERAARAARERSAELRRGLSTLLLVEHVFDLDVLELGTPGEGHTGPVVLRLLGARGQPIGNLVADRLRLEASRAGRVVTLVLEDGRELRHGHAAPFDGTHGGRAGVRRIELMGVDPQPWIETLPELFDPELLELPADDGRHDLARLRLDLNALLREHEAGGAWRLEALGGVVDDVLQDVRLVQLAPRGGVERRLFADRLVIEERAPTSVALTLHDGVQERRGRTVPFLAGRYRIVLPGIDLERWRAARLPGLALEE